MATLAKLIAAVVLGVGAIFGLKGDNDDHWSDPPHISISADVDGEHGESGAPN